MTIEEAIKIIDCYDINFYDLSGEKISAGKLAEAIDMAIEALRFADKSPRTVKLTEDIVITLDEEAYEIGYTHGQMADRPHGEWIPVTERLPEIDETLSLCDQISDEVLGTDTYGNIRHVYLTNCGYLKPTFCTVEEGMSVDIVAWTPLLEPYEEVER